MQKYIECTGKNEDAAIAAALAQLGLPREEVSVEVLELAKPGFLGIGGSPARVKVSYEAPDEPEQAPAPEKMEKAASPKAPESDDAARVTMEPAAEQAEEEVPAAPSRQPEGGEDEDRTQDIIAFVAGLLERMDVQAQPQVQKDAEGNYLVELVGEDLGSVIGRRGETLDAIQQVTNYAVNSGRVRRVRIRMDAEGYRSRREEALNRMAQRMADKAVRYRRNMTLEPMNAYERHVIHVALQDREDVTTYSIGTEPNRRTVVAYRPGEQR